MRNLLICFLLRMPHVRVDAILLQKRVMSAFFDDFPLIEHDNLVRIDHCREPVGNYEGRPVLGNSRQRRLNRRLGVRIER